MHNGLFTSSVTCPICEKNFTVLKVKSTAYRLIKVDEDLCMYYEDLNPLFYDPWVCEHCGYSEMGAYFDRISELENRALQKLCLNKFLDNQPNPFELTDFHKKVYGFLEILNNEGERDAYSALIAYEILMLNLEARNAPYSAKAKAALRIGWMYRFMEDSKELEYLELAAEHFMKAFETEALEDGKFDGATCAFMVGELYRRVNKLPISLEWFQKALIAAPKSNNPKIQEKIRDQIQVVKRSL